jgi:abelson tyrosine-protein kinase 1
MFFSDYWCLDGTLRWQPPETMEGTHPLTQAADVYAFAMCCFEILTKGRMPWPNLDDGTVRHLVLSTLLLFYLFPI